MERKYVAFISYRHAELDSAVAKQLHGLIERYTIPKKLRKAGKKLGLVFRDEEELPISSNLSDDICTALDNSQYLIVLCSKSTCQSPWVTREIEYFLSHHDQQHTLAVLASGEPVDVFPKAITVRREPDGSVVDVEPLAIDVRADTVAGSCRKLKKEIFRLYAALIGCPYDALVQRQQRRRRRQLSALLGLIFAVVSGFLAVTLVKNHQIDLKNRELEQKNIELEEQRAEILLRESALLTEKAQAALEDDRSQDALKHLVDALPNSEENRPYYAPAEQLLTELLDVYNPTPNGFAAAGTTLSQTTNIADYIISPDGRCIITLDDYGLLRGFDSESGELLWQLQPNSTVYVYTLQLLSGPSDRFFAYIENRLYALCWDGTLLWECDAYPYSHLYLSADQSQLAFRDCFSDPDNPGVFQNVFRILSAESGDELQCIDLGSSDKNTPDSFFSEDIDGLSYFNFLDQPASQRSKNFCAWSSDGRYLATACAETFDDGSRQLHYLLLDCVSGECRRLRTLPGEESLSAESGDLYHLMFDDQSGALLALWLPSDSRQAARLDCIDPETGSLLWQCSTPAHEDYWFSYDELPQLIPSAVGLLLTREHCYYFLDPSSGELLAAGETSGLLRQADYLGDRLFSLIFDDGRYTLALRNNWGLLLLDEHYDQPVTLRPLQSARLFSGGALAFAPDSSTLSIASDGGFVLVQPDEQSLEVKYLMEAAALPIHQEISLGENSLLLDHTFLSLPENKALLGKFEDENSELFYALLDPASEETPMRLYASQGYRSDDLFLLSDGSGYLSVDGDILLHTLSDDSVRTLLQNEPHPDYIDSLLAVDLYSHSHSYLSDGRVLSAALEETELLWWLDGEPQGALTLPEGLNPVYTGVLDFRRDLSTTENGYILVADFDDTGTRTDYPVRGCAAYDIAGGQWYYISCEAMRSAVADPLLPQLLLLDGDGRFFLRDIASGHLLGSLLPDIPANSLATFALVPGTTYFAVLTNDGTLLLYDIAAGTLLLQTDLSSGGVSDTLRLAVDKTAHRLFLWNPYTRTGLCLDMDSWTVLARIPGLLHYDPEQNQLWLLRQNKDGSEVLHIAAPMSTAELVSLAEVRLAGK